MREHVTLRTRGKVHLLEDLRRRRDALARREERPAPGGEGEGEGVQVEASSAVVEAHPAECFQGMGLDEVLGALGSSPEGISAEEAATRAARDGRNEIVPRTRHPVLVFLGFMNNPLSWAMEAAAVMAIALLSYADFALILFLLLLNAAIGFREESMAEGAIQALMRTLAPTARVLRPGRPLPETIHAAELVPGDVIVVQFGDVVPADVKLLGDDAVEEKCEVDQSVLTGESMTVARGAGACVYSGSTIRQGERTAVVIATGKNTFFGKTADLVDETGHVGHLYAVMNAIGAVCMITIAVWGVVELSVQFGPRQHACAAGEGGCPTLLNFLVILIGGIPIAMPTVLSVTLALGSSELSKRGAICTRLTAIEELAGIERLCCDKTGTLTMNELTVDKASLAPHGRFSAEELIRSAALSSRPENKEPIDLCLDRAVEGGSASLWRHWRCTRYRPFNPVAKRTLARLESTEDPARVTYLCKGAPQAVLALAMPENPTEFDEDIKRFAERGLRALGVAVGTPAADSIGDPDVEEATLNWQVVGLIPLHDPARPDTAETLRACADLGVFVQMITGDQLPIGVETARELGIGQKFLTSDIFDAKDDPVERQRKRAKLRLSMWARARSVGDAHPDAINDLVNDLVRHVDGFAEVFPSHKYDIVRRLSALGYMVAMTGDGVNDAPALKKADVGIAVANATDAARAAADIALTRPGLGVIADAIRESRKIFKRMRSYGINTVASTVRVCTTFGTLTVAYDWYFSTILTVLFAIFNDISLIALGSDRVFPSRKPDKWQLGSLFATATAFGLYLAMTTWLYFHLASQTSWFPDTFGLRPLDWGLASQVCLEEYGLDPSASPADFDQCVSEVTWERQSMLRALIYGQVSISNMALVFVVRTSEHSLDPRTRPSWPLVVSFLASQTAASLVAALGFGGWPEPRSSQSVDACTYCQHGGAGKTAPLAGTEAVFTDSILGCGWGWLLCAWVWSILWHLTLDPVKFALAKALGGDLPSWLSTPRPYAAVPPPLPPAVDADDETACIADPRPSHSPENAPCENVFS